MAGSLKNWWMMRLSSSSTDGMRPAWPRLRLKAIPRLSLSRFLCQLRKRTSRRPPSPLLQKKRTPSKQRHDA